MGPLSGIALLSEKFISLDPIAGPLESEEFAFMQKYKKVSLKQVRDLFDLPMNKQVGKWTIDFIDTVVYDHLLDLFTQYNQLYQKGELGNEYRKFAIQMLDDSNFYGIVIEKINDLRVFENDIYIDELIKEFSSIKDKFLGICYE